MVETPEQWTWSSYRATAGIDTKTDYLSTDWVIRMFSDKRNTAQKRYRRFVAEGMQQASSWKELQGQILLGDEGFIQKFKHLLDDKEQGKEIPRLQRYVGRPRLVKLFRGIDAKALRDKQIHDAHVKYCYTLKEIADHLNIHYTTMSKVVSKREKE